jgi:hypothetical protein
LDLEQLGAKVRLARPGFDVADVAGSRRPRVYSLFDFRADLAFIGFNEALPSFYVVKIRRRTLIPFLYPEQRPPRDPELFYQLIRSHFNECNGCQLALALAKDKISPEMHVIITVPIEVKITLEDYSWDIKFPSDFVDEDSGQNQSWDFWVWRKKSTGFTIDEQIDLGIDRHKTYPSIDNAVDAIKSVIEKAYKDEDEPFPGFERLRVLGPNFRFVAEYLDVGDDPYDISKDESGKYHVGDDYNTSLSRKDFSSFC